MDTRDEDEPGEDAASGALPPMQRPRLDTIDRCRREMASLYHEAKCGRRDVQAASRLANILALIGRMVEGGDIERRLGELEKRLAGNGGPP